MRHLVIGASGQVGKALINTLHNRHQETIGTYHKTDFNSSGIVADILPGKLIKLDITNYNNIERIIADIIPDIIYLAAAETNVDFCETNLETAETNCTSVYYIIKAINKLNRKKKPLIIFYSTDYVFDGENGPYREDDMVCPINIYGEQKIRAEHCLKYLYEHFIIIRTSGVFGIEEIKKNFVNRLVMNLGKNNTLYIPEDEFISPTFAPDLADATIRVIDNIGTSLRNHESNIIHIAGSGWTSKYNFAKDIAKVFQFDENLIQPIKSSETKRNAKRPLKGGLNIEKVESMIGRRMLHYSHGLNAILNYENSQ